MGHDHLEVPVTAGHFVNRHGPAQLDRRVLGECRAHMERQRQISLDAIAIDRLHPRIEQGNAVVDRAIFDALEAVFLDRPAQQFHAVLAAGIDRGEAHELVRVFLYRPGGYLIVAVDAGRIGITQRKDDRLVDQRHGGIDGIRIGDRAHRAWTGIGRARREQGAEVLRLPEVDVTIDNHRCHDR